MSRRMGITCTRGKVEGGGVQKVEGWRGRSQVMGQDSTLVGKRKCWEKGEERLKLLRGRSEEESRGASATRVGVGEKKRDRKAQ